MIGQANQRLGASLALLVFACLAVGGDARGDGTGGFPVPRYAVGTPDGVVVVDGESRTAIPRTKDVEFFAWDRDGASIVAALETELVRIDVVDGSRATLVSGMASIRFLDVDMSTGRVAFSVGGSEPDQGWRVWICDSDGGSSRPLGSGYSPSFAPDGRVYFEDYTEVGAELFSIDPGEGARTASRAPLFDDGVARYTVACAEDGSFLAWSTAGRLILQDPSGVQRSPSPEEGAYDRFPSFSPDGRFVLFFRSAKDRETMVAHELATGNSQTQETLSPGSLASFAPPPPRGGPDFVALARQNATRSLLDRSGLDPDLDFPRALWLEQDCSQWENSDGAVPVGGPWFFNGVRWLLPSEASALASLKMGQLFLPDLRYLDRQTAEALGEWSGGPLWMDGLSRLDVATLDALLGDNRSLVSFCGLRTIDVELAESFAGVNGSVRLDGVTHMDERVAAALARWAGNGERFMLSLDGLVDPDPAVIRTLASTRGWGLSFGGIRRLTPALLGALGEFRGALIDLDGVTEVRREDVALLKSVDAKWVELRGLREISPEVRAELEASELPYFSLPPMSE